MMIELSKFFTFLQDNGISFFTGVPCSVLKDLCAFISENTGDDEHVIAANEGGAVALAAGYHLATGKTPLVYCQNSGLGNMVNPLLSLADKEVYAFPMVLVVGWRGVPGAKDEPQHIKQGRIQNDLLKVLGLPFEIIGPHEKDPYGCVERVIKMAESNSAPAAVVVKPGCFEQHNPSDLGEALYDLTRAEAIESVLDNVSSNEIIIATTGKASREVYEYRRCRDEGHQNDFLAVGSMGHASQVALGLSLKTERKVLCLDGDGAVFMHMGALAIIGSRARKNLIHVVLNNGCHDSTGGQPTAGFKVDLTRVALGCGYGFAKRVRDKDAVQKAVREALEQERVSMIEILLGRGPGTDLGRPVSTPARGKEDLMRSLGSDHVL